jgi:hypothetical protein
MILEGSSLSASTPSGFVDLPAGAEAFEAALRKLVKKRLDGQGIANPGRVAGLHFFNPVYKMHLVKVIRGRASDGRVACRLLFVLWWQ